MCYIFYFIWSIYLIVYKQQIHFKIVADLMQKSKELEMQLLTKSGKKKDKQNKPAAQAPPRPPPKFAKIPFPQSLFAKPRPIPQKRVIYLDGNIFPPTINQPNIIDNSKYTAVSFLPLVLYHQFRYFFNMFFLLIALSQFVDMLKVGFLFTYVAPLVLVLGFTLLKEAYDDLNRKKRDNETNNQVYTLVEKSGRREILSKDMKVGHIIEINSNQRIPADCIILSTSDQDGTVFIRTDQLDGETDWKLRKAVKFTHNFMSKNDIVNTLSLLATVNAQEPHLDIYKFEGFFKVESNSQQEGCRQGLNLQNTLWGNCFLANGKAIAIIIYTGREMRSVMNTSIARTKMGRTDGEINVLSKILFIFMCILAVIIVLVGGLSQYWLLDLFRQVLLLSSIIPISLRVNLDISKIVFSYKINHDPQIEGALARNSQIPQQLGRVQYILSDKTGTLTQNDMVFKKIYIHDAAPFIAGQQRLMAKILKKNYQQVQGPMADVVRKINEANLLGKKYKSSKRDRYAMVRDFVTCLAVCHNVTPSMDEGKKVYQASSPDQIALVKIAQSVGLQLVQRNVKQIVVKSPLNNRESFTILQMFPFTSASKRMGIVVKHNTTGRIIFYLKGADSVMAKKISQNLRSSVEDQCQELSLQGLRTLVLSQRLLSQKQYENWRAEFDEANAVMINRDAAIEKVVQALEHDMELLGITGVEDKLQEDIQQCLSQLRSARISIWMITGDKVETAICIGISAGLKAPTQDIFVIKQLTDPYSLKNKLNQFSMKTNTVLIIDGTSLGVALHEFASFFYSVATEAPAVICCRVSPTQKAIITKGVKQYTGKIVLGIGDGGNDVGMIQQADIGVGIVGKEGKQAALASDFSILKFKHLSKLLLWHGRLAYKNTSVMAQFVIHRGLIISVIQSVFSLVFYSIAIPIYNGYLMLGYTTVYTMLPVLCLILDQDVSQDKAMQYPQLYQTLQKGRQLNLKTFLIWIWKSIFQGSMIMFMGFWLFEESVVQIVTITFSSLIILELLNIYTELTSFSLIVFVSQILTFAIYILSIVFLKDQIDVAAIDAKFIERVGIIVALTWGPMQIMKYLRKKLDPTENQKIMKNIS